MKTEDSIIPRLALKEAARLVFVVVLFFSAMAPANAQESLGFHPADPSGPSRNSVPAKDIIKFAALTAKWEPHIAALEILERLDKESQKFASFSGPSDVPFGACFLTTDEFFPERHKILKRNVQKVGTYTYLNMRGRPITVPAYSGGPSH